MTTIDVEGRDLRVGDTITVWWQGGTDTITALVPYTGPLTWCFPSGARLATFARLRTGMTIDQGETYQVVARAGGRLDVSRLGDPAWTPEEGV